MSSDALSETELYETELFESFPAPERHIRRLETVATLLGRSPAKINSARVLDIGCGQGALLLAMASELPGATFVGIDSSPAHLERARKAASTLGLTNLSFVETDLRTFDGGGQKFDYIIAHGVFSWVEPDVQQSLLECIERLLAESGVAAVNFNPWPGFHQREVLRSAIGHCIQTPLEGANLSALARDLFASTSELLNDAANPQALALKDEVAQCSKQSNRHLRHTLLGPSISSIPLSAFVSLAKRHGLAFLADARPLQWKGERYRWEHRAEGSKGRLDELAVDELALELLLDCLAPAPFRTALLEKRSATFSSRVSLDKVADLSVASQLVQHSTLVPERIGQGYFYLPNGNEISVPTEWFRNVLRTLEARWPQSVPVSELQTLTPSVSQQELCEELYRWYLRELVEFEATPTRAAAAVTARPLVHPLARMQSASQEWVTTYRHGYATLDPIALAVCAQCDGTRTINDLVEAVIAGRGGELPIHITKDEIHEAVRDALAGFRERALLGEG